MKVIYLIGALKNKKVPLLGIELRKMGFDVFDSWYSAGYEADDKWKEHSQLKGQTYKESLKDYAAQHVFNFDLEHLNNCDFGILQMPIGKSGCIEAGYLIGHGKKVFVYYEKEPEEDRWDVMMNFMTDVCIGFDELKKELVKLK